MHTRWLCLFTFVRPGACARDRRVDRRKHDAGLITSCCASFSERGTTAIVSSYFSTSTAAVAAAHVTHHITAVTTAAQDPALSTALADSAATVAGGAAAAATRRNPLSSESSGRVQSVRAACFIQGRFRLPGRHCLHDVRRLLESDASVRHALAAAQRAAVHG